jgi:glycosyltransferase involved in cell wall biosynthesis
MPEKRIIVYTSMNDLSMFGGMETMIPQEVRYLRSLGYVVHVISPHPKAQSRLNGMDGVFEHHFPSAFRRLPWLLKDSLSIIWISAMMRRIGAKASVMSVSFSVTDGFGVLLAKMSGVEIRMVLRVVGPLSYEAVHFAATMKYRYHIYARIFMILEALTYIGADRILPVSEFEESNIMSYGTNRDKVRIIRCGIDSRRFDGHRDSRPLYLGEESDGVVVFVGRMVEKNGPVVLSDAVPIVVSRRPHVKFVFVGDGPLRSTLETKMAAMVSSGNVMFTGFREDIPDIHAQADVYAGHVSSLVEGLGQTVFEAMMSGLPVVAGDDSISRKIIRTSVNGILVPKDDPMALAEAINALLDDRAKREQLGRMARQTAMNTLSFDSMMAEVLRSC